jgi:hypothetical protein
LWAALLLVTYWWVTDGGISALAGWATGLTALGQLTGLLASVLLLVQVLLSGIRPAVSHDSRGSASRERSDNADYVCSRHSSAMWARRLKSGWLVKGLATVRQDGGRC